MKRINVVPRSGWQQRVEKLGLIWHSVNDQAYWDETAYYSFTRGQIEEIERATNELYQLFLKAGDYVINNHLLSQFGIPSHAHLAIRDSWNREPPALNYGRFDLGYDGINPPKLFEFNADTPTSLLEAAVIQWDWKETVFGNNKDQFNSIHEHLVAQWRAIKPHLHDNLVYFTHALDNAGEDTLNVSYMRDVAEEAGLETDAILINDIGFDEQDRCFVDLGDHQMEVIQHLYPWEWLVNEDFGMKIIETLDTTQWIEPIWKMIFSNKAILPVLTSIAPNHPNLLHTTHERGADKLETGYVKKPILAREGANVEVVKGGEVIASTGGDYGTDGYVYQELFDLPKFAGGYPVIGSWVVDGVSCGMGIREDGLITGNTARFLPHVVED